jgi:hypothetical protein
MPGATPLTLTAGASASASARVSWVSARTSQAWGGRPRAQKRPLDVHRHDAVPGLADRVEVGERNHLRVPGAVDENAEPAESLDGLLDHPLDVLPRANVRADRDGPRPAGLDLLARRARVFLALVIIDRHRVGAGVRKRKREPCTIESAALTCPHFPR